MRGDGQALFPREWRSGPLPSPTWQRRFDATPTDRARQVFVCLSVCPQVFFRSGPRRTPRQVDRAPGHMARGAWRRAIHS